ncbi:hypothetical protein J132_05275 [Termitomyces sp. J132]|nr:hypothetical protein J132_05275 [Termitomyces sp. J132]
MNVQAQIPSALAAIQNFIFDHDSEEVAELPDLLDPVPGSLLPTDQIFGSLDQGPANAIEKACGSALQDQIAQDMWDSYQATVAE